MMGAGAVQGSVVLMVELAGERLFNQVQVSVLYEVAGRRTEAFLGCSLPRLWSTCVHAYYYPFILFSEKAYLFQSLLSCHNMPKIPTLFQLNHE